MWELWRYVWPWSLQFMGCDTMQFDILYRYWHFEICIFAVLVSLTDVYLRLSSLSRRVHAGCKRHCSVNAKKPFLCLMQFVVHSSVFLCVAFPRYYTVAFQPVLYALHSTVPTWMYSAVLIGNYPTWQKVAVCCIWLVTENEYKETEILAERRTGLRNVSNCVLCCEVLSLVSRNCIVSWS